MNSTHGTDEVVERPRCVTDIVHSLTSPNIATRRTVCDILIFLAYKGRDQEGCQGLNIVLGGFDNLMKTRGDPGRFDAWLGTFETVIEGRGRMGSLVGASEEIRSLRGDRTAAALAARDGHSDTLLLDYAVCLFLSQSKTAYI